MRAINYKQKYLKYKYKYLDLSKGIRHDGGASTSIDETWDINTITDFYNQGEIVDDNSTDNNPSGRIKMSEKYSIKYAPVLTEDDILESAVLEGLKIELQDIFPEE